MDADNAVHLAFIFATPKARTSKRAGRNLHPAPRRLRPVKGTYVAEYQT
jgi:hypothetical protein